jgi:hypothetical protein
MYTYIITKIPCNLVYVTRPLPIICVYYLNHLSRLCLCMCFEIFEMLKKCVLLPEKIYQSVP